MDNTDNQILKNLKMAFIPWLVSPQATKRKSHNSENFCPKN